MRKKLKIIIVLLVLLALVFVIVKGYKKANEVKPMVLQGQLEAKETNVSSKISGRIKKIFVKEGEKIHVDTLILQMDSPEIDAKLAQAKAARDAALAMVDKAETGARKQEIQIAYEAMQRAKSNFDALEKTWIRIKTLSKEGLLSQQKADETRAQYISAQKQYNMNKAKYDMAIEGVRTEDVIAAKAQSRKGQAVVDEVLVAEKETRLSSPVSGEVAEIIPNDGEIIAKGMPIVTVINLKDQRLELNVREDYLKFFAVGAQFKGVIPALDGREVNFKVYSSAVLPDFATWRPTRTDQGFDMRTFLIKSRPIDVIKDMRPGMSVIVTLPAEVLKQ